MDAGGSRAGKNCSAVANTTIYSTDFNTDFPVLQLFPESEPTASGTYFKPEKWRARENDSSSIYVSAQQKKSLFCGEAECAYISSPYLPYIH